MFVSGTYNGLLRCAGTCAATAVWWDGERGRGQAVLVRWGDSEVDGQGAGQVR